MDYIKIETNENHTKVEINGGAENLINMLANAMINDPNFGTLVLAAMLAIAEKKDNPLNNLNMN